MSSPVPSFLQHSSEAAEDDVWNSLFEVKQKALFLVSERGRGGKLMRNQGSANSQRQTTKFRPRPKKSADTRCLN